MTMKLKKYKAGKIREEGVVQLSLEKAEDGSFILVVYDNEGSLDYNWLLNISNDGIKLYEGVEDKFGIKLKSSDNTVKINKDYAEL